MTVQEWMNVEKKMLLEKDAMMKRIVEREKLRITLRLYQLDRR